MDYSKSVEGEMKGVPTGASICFRVSNMNARHKRMHSQIHAAQRIRRGAPHISNMLVVRPSRLQLLQALLGLLGLGIPFCGLAQCPAYE